MINIAYRAKVWGKSLGVRRVSRGLYFYNSTRQTRSHFLNILRISSIYFVNMAVDILYLLLFENCDAASISYNKNTRLKSIKFSLTQREKEKLKESGIKKLSSSRNRNLTVLNHVRFMETTYFSEWFCTTSFNRFSELLILIKYSKFFWQYLNYKR